jgi:RimJ/RimL family protein N-acetyltransferase
MASVIRVQRLDKTGSPFEVSECDSQILGSLTDMYEGFLRLAISQGLPPSGKSERRHWLAGLLAEGNNFVAWQDGQVVGHSALLPDLERLDAEYIIFVAEPYRNRGMGTELTTMAVNKAIGMGLKKIWLTVESYNFRAIRVYRNAGFVFVEDMEQERIMVLQL